MRLLSLALLFVMTPLVGWAAELPPAAERKIDFKTDIEPILAKNCWSCHEAGTGASASATCKTCHPARS